MSFLRHELPFFLTGIVGGLVIIEYYVEIDPLSTAVVMATDWTATIFSMAFILGIVSLCQYNYKVFRRRTPKFWYMGAWVIILTLFFFFFGIVMGTTHPAYEWLYWNFSGNLAVINSVIPAFFLTTASYRAFRARSIESTLLLVAALVILITYAPLSAYLWPGLKANYGDWLVRVPNTGMVRGLTIGASIGAICLGFRVLLGKEKAFAIEEVE